MSINPDFNDPAPALSAETRAKLSAAIKARYAEDPTYRHRVSAAMRKRAAEGPLPEEDRRERQRTAARDRARLLSRAALKVGMTRSEFRAAYGASSGVARRILAEGGESE